MNHTNDPNFIPWCQSHGFKKRDWSGGWYEVRSGLQVASTDEIMYKLYLFQSGKGN